MKFFLDSIDPDEIKKYNDYGIIDGLTTNPSLMSTARNINFYDLVAKICELVSTDVSIETPASNYDTMISDGKKILKIAPNIVLKLPITWGGIRACKYFTDQGYKVNMTLCFSVNQALLAAKAGATYVSPFIGRLEDIGSNGIEIIENICDIYHNYEFKTQVLAASIRTVDHVAKAAMSGADIITIPGKLLSKLLDNDLTNQGIEKFHVDWKNCEMKI